LDLRSGQPKIFYFRAQRKVKSKGRLIDSHGKGVADAYVSCSVAASEATPWLSEMKVKNRYAFLRPWTDAGLAESDPQGNYEVELAYGKANLQVIHDGYFSDPVSLEFVVTPDASFTIPELVLYSVLKLRGRVILGCFNSPRRTLTSEGAWIPNRRLADRTSRTLCYSC